MNYPRLIISLIIPQLIGVVGSLFTDSSVGGWYLTLAKPAFNPQGWLFGPVWVILYAMIGVSLYFLWQKAYPASEPSHIGKTIASRAEEKKILWIFCLHLFFNFFWSIIFFGFRDPGMALADIFVLWLFIVILSVYSWPIDRRASVLLWPYFIWVSFAIVLNYYLWILN